MAESVTYADLRFVKAPLKKRISSQLGQDPEADDDGELTYENVQVPSISGGASNLASSGLGDKAGVQSEPPTAFRSSATSAAAGRLSGCRSACSKYLLLGLLLTCLLLGMTAISLGVRYLQVSRQLQHANRVLEATNSSLRQQLRLKVTELGQKEQDLQGSRRKLAQSQEALQVEQRDTQAVKEQFQGCLSSWEGTKEALRHEEEQRRTSEERLNRMRDTVKPFFTCPSQDTCCPVGWKPIEKNCFHFSLINRSWEESQTYCTSLSSKLVTAGPNDHHYYRLNYNGRIYKVLKDDWSHSYWIDYLWETKQGINGKRFYGCWRANRNRIESKECSSPQPCICEREAFRYPD
ncbi:B-cell differentiation antigen CD72 isoform 1-T1 [Molossus nigricans]